VERWIHGRLERQQVWSDPNAALEAGRAIGREVPLDEAIALAFEDDAAARVAPM
jgi:hypothetical protein